MTESAQVYLDETLGNEKVRAEAAMTLSSNDCVDAWGILLMTSGASAYMKPYTDCTPSISWRPRIHLHREYPQIPAGATVYAVHGGAIDDGLAVASPSVALTLRTSASQSVSMRSSLAATAAQMTLSAARMIAILVLLADDSLLRNRELQQAENLVRRTMLLGNRQAAGNLTFTGLWRRCLFHHLPGAQCH